MCRLLEASRSFELKAPGIICCEKLVFVSNIKTPTNDICACEKVSEKLLLPEKNYFNIPMNSFSFWMDTKDISRNPVWCFESFQKH